MTDPTTPAVDRIPLAHSVRYVARGLPEVPNQYGPGVLAPSEITLTYRTASDSQLGRVHAYVAGRLRVDGTEVPLLPGGLYGQHYDDGLDGWPAWLAEEARLHDPDAPPVPAVQAPATDQTCDGCGHRLHAANLCPAVTYAEPCVCDEGAPATGQTAPVDRATAELATARDTNRRLNLRAQRLESELAAYRRAVGQWEISDRGTYIPHSSLRAIGLASGKDILGSVRHLKHFKRVEQAEAAIERVRLLHDNLVASAELTSPDDPIARGAAAKRIAAALDGWTEPAAPSAVVVRRATDETQGEADPRPCGECSHPKGAHAEGEDPVSPGRCADCPESGEEWHDYQPAVGAPQPKEGARP